MSYRIQYLKDNNYWDSDRNRIITTNSTIYLMPLVGLTQYNFGTSLINVHINHSDNPSLVIICMNNPLDTGLKNTIERIKKFKEFKELWYDDDNKEICIEVKIPIQYIETYEHFQLGEWSKFPESYKEVLMDIYTRQVVLDTRKLTVCSVLYPMDYKRKQIAEWLGVEDYRIIKEVKSAPDMNYEIYRNVEQLKILGTLKLIEKQFN